MNERWKQALRERNIAQQRIVELEKALQAVWDYERWEEWEEITGPKDLKHAFNLTRHALFGALSGETPE
jgi:hypothetical protein